MTSSAVIASSYLYGAAAAAEMFSLVGRARVIVGGEERLQIGAYNPEKLKLGFWARLLKHDPDQMHLGSLEEVAGRLSATGEIKGTPAYMAPEQAVSSRGPISPRTDVYGLGGLLFTLLTGAPPHEGASGYNVIVRLVKDPPPGPREKSPHVPAYLARLCLQAMSRDLNKRPASAAVFANILKEGERAERRGFADRSVSWPYPAPLAPALEAAAPELLALVGDHVLG